MDSETVQAKGCDFNMTVKKGAENRSWKTDLRVLTKYLTVQLSWFDPNKYNDRTGTMGAESEYFGFANILLYLQISPKVDMIKVQSLIRELSYLCTISYLSSFIIFFMNNLDGYLKYYSKHSTNEGGACAAVRKAFNEMRAEEVASSKVLKQLTPQDTLRFNQELRRPRNRQNLFVIVHDSDKISFDAQVLNEVEGIEKRFITACVEKDDPIKVGRLDLLY